MPITLLEIYDAGRWPPYAEEEVTKRCCIACGEVYSGPLACPECGEPGEPMGEVERRKRGAVLERS